MFKFRQMPWYVRVGYILEQVSVAFLLVIIILGLSTTSFLAWAVLGLLGSRAVTTWQIERLEQHINELKGKMQ